MRRPDPAGAVPRTAKGVRTAPHVQAEPVGEPCFDRTDRRRGSPRNGSVALTSVPFLTAPTSDANGPGHTRVGRFPDRWPNIASRRLLCKGGPSNDCSDHHPHLILRDLRPWQLSAGECTGGGARIHRHRRECALRGDQPERRRGDDGVPISVVQFARPDARQFRVRHAHCVRQFDGAICPDRQQSSARRHSDQHRHCYFERQQPRRRLVCWFDRHVQWGHDSIGHALPVGQRRKHLYHGAGILWVPVSRLKRMGRQRKQHRERVAADPRQRNHAGG